MGVRRVLAATAVAVTGVVAMSGPAGAAVVGTTGAAQITAAPASLVRNAFESDTAVRVITESAVTLQASLSVSMMDASGTMTTRTMAAGTCIQSYLLHFDAVGASNALTLIGTVAFSQRVVGALPLTPLLELSDKLLGLPGTTYPAGDAARGMELQVPIFNPVGDILSLAGPNTVGFTLRTDGFDQVRVLTQCDPSPVVPEVPRAALLSGSAALTAGGAIYLHRRQRDPGAARP